MTPVHFARASEHQCFNLMWIGTRRVDLIALLYPNFIE